jgi:transposase
VTALRVRSSTRGVGLVAGAVSPGHLCRPAQHASSGRILRQWQTAFLAYFDTGRASNGGTEAINGLIELHRRIARGFTNRGNYRLRMLLIGGGLGHPHLT